MPEGVSSYRHSPSLKDIAKAAGVSVAAVSMALRRHPRIGLATANRIIHLAEELGYHLNPLLQSVMSHVRTTRGKRAQQRIAFVWLDVTRSYVPTSDYHRLTLNGVVTRARQLGWTIEEYYLRAPGMSPARLEAILQARGISSVIFSPCSFIETVKLDLDWTRFAVAVIGNTAWAPVFHRAAYAHYHAMCRALENVAGLGYVRPATILSRHLNERAARMPEAAFLAHHPSPATAHTLVCRIDDNQPVQWTKRWLQRVQPDCLLLPFSYVYNHLQRSLSPHELRRYGIAAMDLSIAGGLAGMVQKLDKIGANAVDLLVGQLLRNERGVPDHPKIVLSEGAWHTGETLPRRAAIRQRLVHA